MTLGSEDYNESRAHGLSRDVDTDSVERGGEVRGSDGTKKPAHPTWVRGVRPI